MTKTRQERAINIARKQHRHNLLRTEDKVSIMRELDSIDAVTPEPTDIATETVPFTADPARVTLAYVGGKMITQDLFDRRATPVIKRKRSFAA